MAEYRNRATITLEIEDGRVTRVQINGEDALEADEKLIESLFQSENGPRYLSTILYSTAPATANPATGTCCAWVYQNGRQVYKCWSC